MSTIELSAHREGEQTLPSWREQNFEQWTAYRPQDIQRIPDDDIVAFDQALTEAMRAAGYGSAKTLEEFRAKMLADRGGKRQARKATPADYRTYTGEQLSGFHKFEAQQRAAKTALAERQAVEEEQQLSNHARRIAEESFSAWTAARQPRDEHGRPTALSPRDGEYVAKMEERFRMKGRTSEKGSRLEVGFFRWLDQAHVFGPQATVEVHPATRYDDLKNGVDGLVLVTIPDAERGSRTIPIGVDFTFSGNEMDLAWKLSRVQGEPVARMKYGAEGFPAQQRFLRAVVSVDEARMQRMTQHLFLSEAARQFPQGASAKSKGDALLAKYQDHDVFMAQVTDELREQLAWGREVLIQQGHPEADLGDHDAILAYLDQLREDRKDLHERARAEVASEGVGAYYRTQDAQFIRHAPELLAGAADGPEMSASG